MRDPGEYSDESVADFFFFVKPGFRPQRIKKNVAAGKDRMREKEEIKSLPLCLSSVSLSRGLTLCQ